jgi:hypothetical protein
MSGMASHTQWLVLGVCGHWWQIDHTPFLDQMTADCPACGRPVAVVIDAWMERYPERAYATPPYANGPTFLDSR